VVVIAIGQIMQLYANLMLPITIRTSVSRLQPFANALLVYLMLGEKTTGIEILAIAVCAACVVYLLFSEPEE
jgi:drug/metabolite transporter (DMT)-like permease